MPYGYWFYCSLNRKKNEGELPQTGLYLPHFEGISSKKGLIKSFYPIITN